MSRTLSTVLPIGVFVGVGLGLALVAFGWFLVPTSSILGFGATMAVLLMYGVFGSAFPARLHRVNPQILLLGLAFGVGTAVVFVGEMVWEYLMPPADNTGLGFLLFGSVFGLYLLSGAVAAYRTGQVRQGIWTAALSAMIGSLVWLLALLTIFYAMRGTFRQARVFEAEGIYEDFARSGTTDFDSFVMEDMMGAGFFHLLLGPLVAMLFGALGGLLGKLAARVRRP